jgi:aspartate/glutamate racemase
MKSDFNRMARTLIKHKINFTTIDTEPRFEIQGQHFTTQELTQLGHENKLTNPDLSEIIKNKAEVGRLNSSVALAAEFKEGTMNEEKREVMQNYVHRIANRGAQH